MRLSIKGIPMIISEKHKKRRKEEKEKRQNRKKSA
jgi:hypothetical protein